MRPLAVAVLARAAADARKGRDAATVLAWVKRCLAPLPFETCCLYPLFLRKAKSASGGTGLSRRRVGGLESQINFSVTFRLCLKVKHPFYHFAGILRRVEVLYRLFDKVSANGSEHLSEAIG